LIGTCEILIARKRFAPGWEKLKRGFSGMQAGLSKSYRPKYRVLQKKTRFAGKIPASVGFEIYVRPNF